MLLAHPIINNSYFFPRAGSLEETTWVETGQTRLACYHKAPHPHAKTLVYFHGNGEIVADYIPYISEAFIRLGLNVFFAEYRGYGDSTGLPTLPSILSDIPSIIEKVGVAPEHLVLLGRSIGSIFAVEAMRLYPDLAGVILESGIADPFERLALRARFDETGISAQALQSECDMHLNHKRVLENSECPLLVLHTLHDHIVDYTHGERLFEWSKSHLKQKHIFDRGDHNTILVVNTSEYMSKVHAFVHSLA